VDDGWALGGGIAGLITTIPVTVLSTLAMVNIDDNVPAIPFGGTALGFVMSTGPVVHAAGASARNRAGVKGLLGLRIPAWILYGLTIGVGVSLLVVGVAHGSIYMWQIATAMGMGDLSLALFSADALVARSQVRQRMGARSPSRAAPMALAPVVAPFNSHTGTAGGVIGLGGAF
jgi:hypothetical protein